MSLIGATTTETGLEIRAKLDDNPYPVGQKVTKQQMKDLSIKQDEFHGEWNYTIEPRR